MLGDDVGVVSVQGVPEDRQRHREELKGHGALDGLRGAVAGLFDAEDVLGVFVGDFDRPAVGVAFDDLRGGAGQVGGDPSARSGSRRVGWRLGRGSRGPRSRRREGGYARGRSARASASLGPLSRRRLGRRSVQGRLEHHEDLLRTYDVARHVREGKAGRVVFVGDAVAPCEQAAPGVTNFGESAARVAWNRRL